MEADKQPTAIDTHVGNRIRVRRTFLRVSQEKLGEHIGVSFQQIQKYEKGANRIGAGQLFHIAKLLKVEPNYFFEGLGVPGEVKQAGFGEPAMRAPIPNIDETTEGLALNRAFARIKSAKVRRRIVEMVASIADDAQE